MESGQVDFEVSSASRSNGMRVNPSMVCRGRSSHVQTSEDPPRTKPESRGGEQAESAPSPDEVATRRCGPNAWPVSSSRYSDH